WAPHHHGGDPHLRPFLKDGLHQLRFLLGSLRDLRETLKKKGSTLAVRKGKLEDLVRDPITQLPSISAVMFHEEVKEI
ncbi:CRYD protein, partial [Upupa epops]|nr:CRYD protein [Upupa epops]